MKRDLIPFWNDMLDSVYIHINPFRVQHISVHAKVTLNIQADATPGGFALFGCPPDDLDQCAIWVGSGQLHVCYSSVAIKKCLDVH